MEETPSSMHFLILHQVEFLREANDDPLSQWELVDLVDDHEHAAVADSTGTDVAENGAYSLPDTLDFSDSSFYSSSTPIITNAKKDRDDANRSHFAHDANRHFTDDLNRRRHFADEHGGLEEDVEDYDDDELNDELVPWDVCSKLGRQRMRKLGKRVFPKMTNSKRNPNLFVTPGALRGKHGLGLKHNL